MFSSCNEEKTVEFERVQLDERVLKEATPMKAETLWTSDELPLAAKECLVYKDSVLIVVNSKECDWKFVQLFNLQTRDSIASFFHKGKGRGELLYAEANITKNILTINDFKTGRYAFVNMDSATRVSDYTPAVRQHQFHTIPLVVPFGNTLLMENPYCFTSKSLNIRQGIEYGTPRFIKSEDFEDYMAKDAKQFKYNTQNVAMDGQILINPEKGKVCYACFDKSEVEFYDDDLSLVRRVDGPVKIEECYTLEDWENEAGQRGVCYKKRIPYAYMSSSADEDNAYLNYLGQYFCGSDETPSEEMPSYIMQFDWDGNFERCYSVGRRIRSFTKSLKEKDTFYATAFDDSARVCLVKLTPNEK